MAANLWTPDDDVALRKAVLSGETSGHAMSLFPGRSRNAVIGRAHRLGLHFGIGGRTAAESLPKPPKPPKPAAMRKPPAHFFRAGMVPAPHPERVGKPSAPGQAALRRDAAQPTAATNVRFIDRKPSQCVFMLGSGMNAMVCGAVVRAEAEPYCQHHHNLTHVAYTPGLRSVQRVEAVEKAEVPEAEEEPEELTPVDEFEGEPAELEDA